MIYNIFLNCIQLWCSFSLHLIFTTHYFSIINSIILNIFIKVCQVIYKQLVLSLLQIFVIFYIYGFFIHKQELFLSFGFNEMSIFIGTYLFMMLYSPISYITGILSLKLSRYFEFQADDFATKYNYGDLLCNGLIKLVKENKSNLNPDPVFAAFKYSHPTLLERIKFINNRKKE